MSEKLLDCIKYASKIGVTIKAEPVPIPGGTPEHILTIGIETENERALTINPQDGKISSDEQKTLNFLDDLILNVYSFRCGFLLSCPSARLMKFLDQEALKNEITYSKTIGSASITFSNNHELNIDIKKYNQKDLLKIIDKKISLIETFLKDIEILSSMRVRKQWEYPNSIDELEKISLRLDVAELKHESEYNKIEKKIKNIWAKTELHPGVSPQRVFMLTLNAVAQSFIMGPLLKTLGSVVREALDTKGAGLYDDIYIQDGHVKKKEGYINALYDNEKDGLAEK
ncbi:hypothetical protein G5S52_00730 [Grimontia sp. S25]|uniref:Uncharacterized protein n=1 Tax=Grimontia sedimenti TaxID=2711294 RepID=A0A6M1RF72_9GAMM|nr:hypothetical protein [Grimontia sedimenti]NGN96228.1 hypothetical protein [Grimontia sedimenti]